MQFPKTAAFGLSWETRGCGRLLAVFASVLLLGCGQPAEILKTADQTRPTCLPTPADNLPWAQFHEQPITVFPYMATYGACGKTLIYVAARHQADARTPTHQLVIRAFKSFNPGPGLVLVEGYVSTAINQPTELLRKADLEEGQPSDSEALLAIRTAHQMGGDFRGAEAPDDYSLPLLLPLGFDAHDQMNFHILRSIERWMREDQLTDHRELNLADHIERVDAAMAPAVRDALTAPLSVQGFVAWYEAMNGVSFADGYQPEDAYFTHPRFNRRSNDLARAVADIRDRHIVEVIAESLQRHEKIIVVYGGGHHLIHAKALEHALGPPKITR